MVNRFRNKYKSFFVSSVETSYNYFSILVDVNASQHPHPGRIEYFFP